MEPVPIDPVRTEIATRIAEHDRTGAVRASLDAVRAGRITINDLHTRVLIPVLIDTGSSWQRGETAVWEEHLTSSIVRTVIESLALDVAEAAAAVPANGRTVVLACPSGEQHDLGLRMLDDRLAMRGWRTHYLGADTPASEVVGAGKALGADLIALSSATHYSLVLLRRFVDDVRQGLPGVRVGVGGPALQCDHRWPAEDLLMPDELGLDDAPDGFCTLPERDE